MEATLALSIAALLISLLMAALIWAPSGRGQHFGAVVSALVWGGFVISFAALSAGWVHGPGALLATASFAACLALTAVSEPRARWPEVTRQGSVFGVALALCATVLVANTYAQAPTPDANLILIAGQWAALGAALVYSALALGAATPRALMMWPLAALLGALWLGASRASTPTPEALAYAVRLSSEGEVLRWALPALTPSAPSFAFDVTQRVPGAPLALLVSLGATAAGALLPNLRLRRLSLWLGALGALGALGLILWTGFHAALPDPAPYAEHAYALGLERSIPERVLEMGAFTQGVTVSVRWVDVLPDLGLLSAAAAWLAIAASFTPREEEARSEALQIAPWLERLASLLAVAWVLGLIVNWRVHAIYGVGSATEWTLLGAAIVAAGGALIASRSL